MATSIRSKHFAGYNRSGHHTPAQFRNVVQDLLACEAVNSLNSGSFSSGTGGRIVRRMVPTDTGLVLTMQANGLRQTYIVFTDDPEAVAQMLRDTHGFEGEATASTSEYDPTTVTPNAPRNLPDLSWLTDDTRRFDSPDRGLLEALIALAQPNTGWLPRQWNGKDVLDSVTRTLAVKHNGKALLAAVDVLTADGRVHLTDTDVRVLVPLDTEGRLVLPPPLLSPEQALDNEPPLSDVAVDEELAFEALEQWADRQAQTILDAGCPAFIRPFLRDGLLDAAATWLQHAQDEPSIATPEGDGEAADCTLDDLRQILRLAPRVIKRTERDLAVQRARLSIAEAAVASLERQTDMLRRQIADQQRSRDVLALMKDACQTGPERQGETA